MVYYLIKSRDTEDFQIVQATSNQVSEGYLIASSLESHYMGGATLPWEEIYPKDFPLYLSSLKFVSEEFEDVMSGKYNNMSIHLPWNPE